MEEAQRRALRRGRPRLVAELRVAPLWEPLELRGLFTRTMIEELQVRPGDRPEGGPLCPSLPGAGLGAGPPRPPSSRDRAGGGRRDPSGPRETPRVH